VRTVGQLRDALKNFADDIPFGMCVYNHSWYSPAHSFSHGEARVGASELNGQPIVIIYVGAQGWPRDGWCLKPAEEAS